MTLRTGALVLLLAVVLVPALAAGQGVTLRERVQFVKVIAVGGRVDWSHSHNLIALDKVGDDRFSDVYIALPDGSGKQCLTCGKPLPQAHNGNPSWHPSGGLIVFQSQDPALAVLPAEKQPIAYRMTSPGWGTNNNLWLMTSNGTQFWQLTEVAAGMGVLHPQFNRLGSKLLWAEKIGLQGLAEQWTMRLADLTWEFGKPNLKNVEDIHPFGINFFYETHGFTPDGRKIIFTAGDPSISSLDIYLYDLLNGEVRNLTNTPDEYDEHAHISPDGTQIIWASSRGIDIPRDYFVPFTDYWVMDIEGRNQSRLTYFNDPQAPEYYPGGVVVADFGFDPSGQWLVSKLELTQTVDSIVEVIVVMK